MIRKLWLQIHSLISSSLFYKPNVSGSGEFGSRGGTNEYQTETRAEQQLFLEEQKKK